MGYLAGRRSLLDAVLADMAEGKISFEELKRAIREKLLEWYKNGIKPQIDNHGSREPVSRMGRRLR